MPINMKGFLMSNGGDGGWDAWLFHAWLGTNGDTFLSDAGDPLFNSAAGTGFSPAANSAL